MMHLPPWNGFQRRWESCSRITAEWAPMWRTYRSRPTNCSCSWRPSHPAARDQSETNCVPSTWRLCRPNLCVTSKYGTGAHPQSRDQFLLLDRTKPVAQLPASQKAATRRMPCLRPTRIHQVRCYCHVASNTSPCAKHEGEQCVLPLKLYT
ncbi:hypothetical protein DQ04_08541010 [Trypanosoma grayi]|uniref:hypothetical protein n=1 Tax=Trypanosoma grayi TaxID=71804 RepID=UPI0004F41E5E|nr:hypothetical protein DQ04_08541010 [Trypanosoma grayi]KEG07893.1 hypothetical protein DQ04_08541010 [Trypanosoma grayi]